MKSEIQILIALGAFIVGSVTTMYVTAFLGACVVSYGRRKSSIVIGGGLLAGAIAAAIALI